MNIHNVNIIRFGHLSSENVTFKLFCYFPVCFSEGWAHVCA